MKLRQIVGYCVQLIRSELREVTFQSIQIDHWLRFVYVRECFFDAGSDTREAHIQFIDGACGRFFRDREARNCDGENQNPIIARRP